MIPCDRFTPTRVGKMSRDDADKIINTYVERGIFEKDPFVTLDQDGVGGLGTDHRSAIMGS